MIRRHPVLHCQFENRSKLCPPFDAPFWRPFKCNLRKELPPQTRLIGPPYFLQLPGLYVFSIRYYVPVQQALIFPHVIPPRLVMLPQHKAPTVIVFTQQECWGLYFVFLSLFLHPLTPSEGPPYTFLGPCLVTRAFAPHELTCFFRTAVPSCLSQSSFFF